MSKIICSLFNDFSTTNGGIILNTDQIDAEITNCRFVRVTTNSYPGLFSVKNSIFKLEKCSFLLCYSGGNNEQYGRIAFLTYSTVNIEHFSAISCGPKEENNGDSIIRVEYGPLNTFDFNTSLCYGMNGASTFSIYYQTNTNQIKYMNNVDCIDWSCIEGDQNTYEINIEHSSFVNSTMNSHYCINIHSSTKFVSCYFLKTHSSFCYDSKYLTLNNCFSDEAKNGFTFESITNNLPYRVIIKKMFRCNILCTKVHTKPLSLNLSLIITFLLS